jgi:acylphosphatase
MKIIAIAGRISSGKTTIAQYLQKKGYLARSYSHILTDLLKRLYLPVERTNLQKLGAMLRKTFGGGALANALIQDIKNSAKSLIVVDGVRYENEYELLSQIGDCKLLYVSANTLLRYKRTTARGTRGEAGITYEQFLENEKKETERHIPKLKKFATIIKNEGTIEDLYKQVDLALKDEIKRLHVWISGKVQGVFFRANTQKKAKTLGLSGWVKNLANGQVEAVFEGDEEKLNKMLEWCKHGPELANVTHVEVKWESPEGLKDFCVRY